MTEKTINNGDVFDIGQTVNGVSRFIYWNDKWYYFEERITRKYEYSQEDLTELIRQDKLNGDEEVTFLGNVFSFLNKK